ncbi:MAG TPA: V4R domain-containing protein [Gemmatimonadales bacterium]
MTSPASGSSPRQHHSSLRLGRRVLHQLRASLERDTGLQASTYLQEAGFAGGEELYAEFCEWLLATRGVERPAELDTRFLSEVLSEFFTDQGWGALTATPRSAAVLALDSTEWAEAAEDGRGEFPSCHLTCGLLADFFGRLSDGLVAVMEVECRSRGDGRCRFLAGAPETLGALYDRMAQGAGYGEALGA